MIRIEVFDPGELKVQQIKAVVHTVAPLTSRILFEGELWKPVRRVAIALDRLQPIGLATLSPTDENGVPGSTPEIIGIWVHPDYRRQHIATNLLHICIQESLRRWNIKPKLICITTSGLALARNLQQMGETIEVENAHVGGDLP